MNEKLNAAAAFPAMTIPLVGGGQLSLPASRDDGYQVVLFYRGSF